MNICFSHACEDQLPDDKIFCDFHWNVLPVSIQVSIEVTLARVEKKKSLVNKRAFAQALLSARNWWKKNGYDTEPAQEIPNMGTNI